MTTSFNRIDLHTGDCVYLLVHYKNVDADEFLLSVSDGKKVWKGKFDEDDIEDMRKTLKMDYDSLLKKTKDALTCEHSSEWSFEYKLNSQRSEFQWYYAPDKDLTYMLGSCALKPANDASKSMCEILNHCIDRHKELKENTCVLQTDYDRISQERANALKRLEKCVVAKEELEKELYAKFVDVLNSKKDKIRKLKDNYTNGTESEAGPSGAKDEPIKTGQKKVTKRSAPCDGPSDEDRSDVDTTDEEMSSSSKGKKSKKTVKKSLLKAESDSVVLDTGDNSLGMSMVSRPRRNAEGNKRKTPSKPILPKVSSTEHRQERPVRMKKSITGSSSTSNRSSDNIDADDLIDNL
ncbi:DNA repair protein XRCC4-like [Ostrea edulis]|uniref:DNA repair protein XRCC4-like n=1 Tax=Ostrea edulis TaxID=37623 RepID=UPI0024AFEAF1|nr:DNA repair protein XRCC4-like [Ostrea edulis]XP_055998564.1 DNA repair protein XRCC4-like [Ostrea edulis]